MHVTINKLTVERLLDCVWILKSVNADLKLDSKEIGRVLTNFCEAVNLKPFNNKKIKKFF